MNILFATSEVSPIHKTGGLGDYSRSLPLAIHKAGHDIRIILPGHAQIDLSQHHLQSTGRLNVTYDRQHHQLTIWEGHLKDTNIPVIIFTEPDLITTHTLERENDKYAFFSKSILTWIQHHQSQWYPDIIHLNDWQTALVPLLLKHTQPDNKIGTLLTIHNLNYQGKSDPQIISKLDIDSDHAPSLAWDIADGDLDILMQGMIHADMINTVSPNYAKEILTHQYGAGLESILAARLGRVTGVLNGIDNHKWDPASDDLISFNYQIENAVTVRQKNKQQLLDQFGWKNDSKDSTLLGFIGRVDPQQKGIDLLYQAIQNQLLSPQHRLIFLGQGDQGWESQLEALAAQHENFSVALRYDEQLAHQMYASCDLMIIPSRYEPCGLVQLIAMRYGCIPIGRATGGLKDTIEPQQTGFLFNDYNWHQLKSTVEHATQQLSNPQINQTMIQNAMNKNNDWSQRVSEYTNIYNRILNMA